MMFLSVICQSMTNYVIKHVGDVRQRGERGKERERWQERWREKKREKTREIDKE